MNRGFMSLCCALLALAAFSMSPGGFAEAGAQTADRPIGDRPDGPTLDPGVRPAVTMCCGRGARRWITTLPACRREGGRPLPESACRKGRRVCCKRGSGYFLATAGMCTGKGRVIVPTGVCTEPGKHVCCSARRYPRLSYKTRRQCDQFGGRAVEARLCRTHPDRRSRASCCLAPDGSRFLTLRECRAARGRPAGSASCRGPVCCERNGRRFLTRHAQCRQEGGDIISQTRCRAQGGTVRPR